MFNILKEKYNLSDKDKNECGFYRINDMIEIVPNSKSNFATMEVDGYYIEDLHKILEFKKNRNLPKDKADISNIETYLQNM